MDWKLEVVVVPVSDIDRARRFYSEQCGFNVDVDRASPVDPNFRVVQLTPPGSACSITLGQRVGMQLCVSDIEAARTELVSRGVECSPVRHLENGIWKDGKGEPWNAFIFFQDPDGNAWTVQEKPE